MELKDYVEGLGLLFSTRGTSKADGTFCRHEPDGWSGGQADLTGPYKVGIVLCLIFLVQVYFTRHFQSLPPAAKP